MSTIQGQAADTRPCAYCGKPVPSRMTRCPYCREEVREVRLSERSGKDGRREIRRGLIYMLLGGVIYYFAGGYSAIPLPYQLSPLISTYLSPAVFLGGLGLTLYGIMLRIDLDILPSMKGGDSYWLTAKRGYLRWVPDTTAYLTRRRRTG